MKRNTLLNASYEKYINLTIKAHFIRGAFYLLLLLAVCVIPAVMPLASDQRQIDAPLPKPEEPTGGVCVPPAWRAGADMPSTGVRMVGVYFQANGKFYAVGGRSMDGVGNDFTHPFEYNPSSNTWTIKSATYPDNQ